MQTVLDILNKAGGWHPGLYLKIENAPFMELVIEGVDESGPCGFSALSVAHFGKQNGDAMRDPEMCFELELSGELNPFHYRNDYIGVEQWSRFVDETGYVSRRELFIQHVSFAKVWDSNPATCAPKALSRHSIHTNTYAVSPSFSPLDRSGDARHPVFPLQHLQPTTSSRRSLPSLERFRTAARYQDRPAAADLAFCVAAIADGMAEHGIARALDDYLSRDPRPSNELPTSGGTIKKARRWAERRTKEHKLRLFCSDLLLAAQVWN